MKFLVAIIFAVSFMPFASAQIMESAKPMSQGNNNAMTVTLPDTDVKVVEKEWEDFIKDYKAKLRKIKKSSEIFGDDARIESISKNTVDVYALVSERGDDTELTVWYDLGGAYLNSKDHPTQYGNAQKMLNDFSGIVSKTYIANILNEEEKKLKDLEKTLEDIEKSQEDSLKDIEKYEEKIVEEKANIEECKSKKEAAMKDVESQKMVVKKVKTQLNN